MTLQNFFDKETVTVDDLFGEWQCKGAASSTNITKNLQSYLLPHLKKEIRSKKIKLPMDLVVKFKRDKSSGQIGETMRLYDNEGNTIYSAVQNTKGFTLMCESSSSLEDNAFQNNNANREVLIAKEIQDATPIEERKGWTNYELLEKLMHDDADRAVKFWETHDKHGKPL